MVFPETSSMPSSTASEKETISVIEAKAIELLRTLVGSDTTSYKSNLELIEFIQSYFYFNSPLYILVYFGLVVAFTYFYVSITFNPEQVAEDLQKRGGYIPGIRPGKETSDYLGKVSNRLNLHIIIHIIPICQLRVMKIS